MFTHKQAGATQADDQTAIVPTPNAATPGELVSSAGLHSEHSEITLDQISAPSNVSRKLLPQDRLQRIDDLRVKASFSDGSINVELTGRIQGEGNVSANIHCRKAMSLYGPGIMVVESSNATGGTGPIALDIAMEISTHLGLPLTSDRKRVSHDAFKVWDYYLRQRPDVTATELPIGQWYDGHRAEALLGTMTDDKATWPGKEHPIWALWHGYTKPPDIITTLTEAGQLALKDLREPK